MGADDGVRRAGDVTDVAAWWHAFMFGHVIFTAAAADGSFVVRGLWCAQDSRRVLDADRPRAQNEGSLV